MNSHLTPEPAPIYGVILSGGSGTRFWPLSRSQCPKQVLHFLGSDSLFQTTIDRLLPRLPLKNIFVITNSSQEDVIRLELYRNGWENITLWLPVNESIFIPLKTAHHLANSGTEPVIIIEVQTGSYLEEDDIIRLDDDFGRFPKDALNQELSPVTL